jgi:hypothetical protein
MIAVSGLFLLDKSNAHSIHDTSITAASPQAAAH